MGATLGSDSTLNSATDFPVTLMNNDLNSAEPVLPINQKLLCGHSGAETATLLSLNHCYSVSTLFLAPLLAKNPRVNALVPLSGGCQLSLKMNHDQISSMVPRNVWFACVRSVRLFFATSENILTQVISSSCSSPHGQTVSKVTKARRHQIHNRTAGPKGKAGTPARQRRCHSGELGLGPIG